MQDLLNLSAHYVLWETPEKVHFMKEDSLHEGCEKFIRGAPEPLPIAVVAFLYRPRITLGSSTIILGSLNSVGMMESRHTRDLT